MLRIFVFLAAAFVSTHAMAADETDGKALYINSGCYECHGWNGQGAGIAGPHLTPIEVTQEGFAKQLRTPMREMPPYTAKVLSDKQLAAIYGWIKSLPAPPNPATIKLLQ